MSKRRLRVWNGTARAIVGVALLGASAALGGGYAGELDTTFGGGTGIVTTSGMAFPVDVAIQSINGSQRYLVAGQTQGQTDYDGWDWAVLAYTPSGSLDQTFGEARDGIVRLFQTDPGRTVAYGVSLDEQNRVVTVGSSTVRTTGTGNYTGLTVVRQRADGFLDQTFNGTGIATVWAGSPDGYNEWGLSVVAVPASLGGGVLTAGVCCRVESPARGRNPAVVKRHTFFAKFRDDGTLDTTFGPDRTGIAYDPRSSSPGSPWKGSLLLQRDGKIVVTGSLDFPAASPGYATDVFTPSYSWALSRFKSDGTLDTTFGSKGRVIRNGARVKGGEVSATDDSIVAVGDGSTAGEAGGLVARYLKNGAPDLTFDLDGYAAVAGWANGPADVVRQPDGRVVFSCQTLVGSAHYGLVGRFAVNGSPDPSFGGTGYTQPVASAWWRGVAEAADGIVVVGGAEPGFPGSSIFVARYGK